MVDKLIQDGRVAVLHTAWHGAGWSTWAEPQEKLTLLFEPDVAEVVMRYRGQKYFDEIKMVEEIRLLFAIKAYASYQQGASHLTVRWIPQGTQFRIREHDGLESVELNNQIDWIHA
jgi:hypothetical protein